MFQETAGNGMETFLIFGYGLEMFQWRFQAVFPLFKFPKRGTKFPLPFLEVSGNLEWKEKPIDSPTLLYNRNPIQTFNTCKFTSLEL